MNVFCRHIIYISILLTSTLAYAQQSDPEETGKATEAKSVDRADSSYESNLTASDVERIVDRTYLDFANSRLDHSESVSVKIIQLSAYIVAVFSAIFTVTVGVVSWFIRKELVRLINDCKKRLQAVEEYKNKIEGEWDILQGKLTTYFTETEARHIIHVEIAEKLAIINTHAITSDQLYPAVTYIGERGSHEHIQPLVELAAKVGDQDAALQDGIKEATRKIISRYTSDSLG